MMKKIPDEYLSPKWQAYVRPQSSYFVFANGVSVGSMWQLKQALLKLSDEVIFSHLEGNKHDIADWVETVVGDDELAKELRRYKHRWGLVVSLERQMMRTLLLPDFVAKRWLAQTQIPFEFESGEKVKSIKELKEGLEKVSDEVVAFHCERKPNDMAVWVASVVGDYELADLLETTDSKSQMVRMTGDHLVMLEEAVEC